MMQMGTTVRRPANAARRFVAAIAFAVVVALGGVAFAQQMPSLSMQSRNGEIAVAPPANNLANTLGTAGDSDIWRQVRRGGRGIVSFPDPAAGVLIQSEGQDWRAIRNGPLKDIGWWLLAVVVALLSMFFALRGRIGVAAGPSERRVERFAAFERFVHWLTAGSFVILALTGLNMLYGRYLFANGLAVGGGEFSTLHQVFATFTHYGKITHNALGFSFIIGVVLMFVIWVRDNLPNRHDITWILKGGGMFAKGEHLPVGRFNAGQKVIFWSMMVFGLILFGSGLSLMFPFFWFDMRNMQLVNLIHSGVALIAIAFILGHIYIGTIGMEGVFDAMGTGKVDENWAREHHSLWLAEIENAPLPDDADGGGGPAAGRAAE